MNPTEGKLTEALEIVKALAKQPCLIELAGTDCDYLNPARRTGGTCPQCRGRRFLKSRRTVKGGGK